MALVSATPDRSSGPAKEWVGAVKSAPRRSDARDAVRPFLLGTAVGGVAGAVAGTLLSHQTRRLLVGLLHVITRRLSDAEREELRFELLLQ